MAERSTEALATGLLRSCQCTGFAQTFGVRGPLPPTAALPLFKGENALIDIAGFIVPLTKGDGRRRRQGVAHTEFLCKALRGAKSERGTVSLIAELSEE